MRQMGSKDRKKKGKKKNEGREAFILDLKIILTIPTTY